MSELTDAVLALNARLQVHLAGLDRPVLVTEGVPASDEGVEGIYALDVDGLAFYGPKTGSSWGDPRVFGGVDGREVELRTTATHIQWRYVGDASWINLLALTDITGDDGDPGANGWTPVLAAVSDGERRVQQIVDWTGGTGTKPATGAYVGPSGPTATIGDATNIRGAAGAGTGDMLAANNLSDLADKAAARTTLDVYSKGEGDGRYVQSSGLNELIDDRVAALLKAGANITLTYSDSTGELTIAASGGGGGGGLAGVTDYVLADLMDSASSAAIQTPWGFADPLASSGLLDLATSTGETYSTGYVDNFTTPSLSVQGTPSGSANLSFGSSTAVRPSGTEAAGDVGIVLFYIRPTSGTTPIDVTGCSWRNAAMTQVGFTTSTNGARLYVFRYTITGSESGAAGVAAFWGGSIEARSAINAYRVRGANPVITATFATGTNPPNLTGLAADKTNLFLAAVGGSSGTDSNAEPPADYTDAINAANFTGATSIVSARRFVAATSNDPGTFTNAPSGPGLTLACTVGIEVGAAETSSMSLVWNAFTAPAVPARAAVMVEVEPISGSITPNTNVLVDVSRDNGVTWTEAVLSLRKTVGAQRQLAAVVIDLSAQPSGQTVRLRARANTDNIRIHKAGVLVG